MKNGLVHVDWVISFSIFFLYLAFIFAFVKPVRFESTGGDQVLNLVENGVRSNVYWNLTKLPLFVDCNGCGSSLKDICLDVYPFTWNTDSVLLTDKDGNKLKFRIEDCLGPASEGLAFTYSFGSGKNIFWLIYAHGDNIIGYNDWTCNDWDSVNNECRYIIEGSSSNEYQYQYGLPEFITGISGRELRDFGSMDYDAVKNLFGLPVGNEFSIDVLDRDRTKLFSYEKVMPDRNNVYVREWSDRLLFNDTSSNSVIVSIRAF